MARPDSARPAPPQGFVAFAREQTETSVPRRFDAVARLHAGRVAVRTPLRELTYAQLALESEHVAGAVLARVGPGEPVALLMRNDAGLVSAILGVLRAGCFYVPLGPDFPQEHNAAVLADCGARLVLAEERTLDLARALAAESVCVLDAEALSSRAMPGGADAAPGALAYIYYTSGSTGRPKGVMDTHRNVLHNVMRYTNNLRIGPGDRLTLLQPPPFSGAVSSLFCALLNGATVCPYDVEERGAARVAEWIAEAEITIYHSVPSLFRVAASSRRGFSSVRVVRLEGDRALWSDARLFRERFSARAVLANGLGATECGIVRQFFVDSETPLGEGALPIGYAVEDMEVIVLDESRSREAPRGGIGEIAVRSRHLSPGYWNDPVLTADAFVDDGPDGARVYRTGDLGRMRDDGCLEYIGRRALEARVRGQWVDTARVEEAVVSTGIAREAAVAARPDPAGEARLVAYVVPSGEPPTVGALRRAVAGRLPDALIPSVWVTLQALPLNASGKVDRRALPDPDSARPALANPFVAPRTPVEKMLAGIWARCLGLDEVGVEDDFLELGGHSLAAARIVSCVEDEFGVYLGQRTLVALRTVAALAPIVIAGMVEAAGDATPDRIEG